MATATTTRKTACPISREQFNAHAATATPVVSIAGQGLMVMAKQFSTGSMGYSATGKVQLLIDGIPTMCQVGLNITVIGSKDLAQ
jgi:hypothetical protein